MAIIDNISLDVVEVAGREFQFGLGQSLIVFGIFSDDIDRGLS